ncbi:metallophosphoesterase [Moritella sp. 36]|uniref:metallophosphoesterase family protein n=1 Tax=Moritella sp. 36 TaxID=2746233 RepID=UPI001BAD6E76|nr:metallophosphoesterase [Moritella sp. 36]QUM87365.1 metallophosphoesterase [Moritella sp. 36]
MIHIISDCHLGNTENETHLIKALMKIGDDCKFLFVMGDIYTSPSIEKYNNFKNILNEYIPNAKVYAIAGNHDDINLMRKSFSGSNILIKEKVNIDGMTYLFIDSSHKPINRLMMLGSGRVSNKDLSKIKKESRKKEVTILIHHPILKVSNSKWFNEIGIENADDIINKLNKNCVNIICGHGHDFNHNKHSIFQQTMSPSTAYGFDLTLDEFMRTNRTGALILEYKNQKSTFQYIKTY